MKARKNALLAHLRRQKLEKKLKNIAQKSEVQSSGPKSKTIIYTDKNGNKVIEKTSHSTKRTRTKNGVTITSSSGSSINTVSPGGSFMSVNSGGNGIVITGNHVFSLKPHQHSRNNFANHVGNFERFYGPMYNPFLNNMPTLYNFR
jgi:predicted PilT family ATPase